MINRSVLWVRHTDAFRTWLASLGLATPEERVSVYLIPAYEHSDEAEEILEDLFGAILFKELEAWCPDQSQWPDTGDYSLFSSWFTTKSLPYIDDLGQSCIVREE